MFIAVLVVCYFWSDFKVHATDVYHRYVTSDVTLAVEIVENGAEKDGLAAMKLVEMEKKMAEFQEIIMSERSARMDLEKKALMLEGGIAKETRERKRKFAALEEKLDDVESALTTTEEEIEGQIQDARDEFQHAIETRRQSMIPHNEIQSIKLWWNENTQLDDGPAGKLVTRDHIWPVFKNWADMYRLSRPDKPDMFVHCTMELVGEKEVVGLTHVPKTKGTKDGFSGRALIPM